MAAIGEVLEPGVAADKKVGNLAYRIVALCRDKLLIYAALQDNRRRLKGIVAPSFGILELTATDKRRIGHLEPSLGFKNAGLRIDIAIPGALHHTNTGNIEEVETDRCYILTLFVVIEKGVVGLQITIQISTHKGYRIVTTINCGVGILVVIPHQHHGIVVHCVAGVIFIAVQGVDSISHRCFHRLTIDSSRTVSGNGDTIFSCAIIGYIILGVAQIGGLRPVRLDGNLCHPVGHLPVGALVKNATADGVEILVGAATVHEVIGWCIGTSSKTALGSTYYTHNLPTRHHSSCVVIGTGHGVVAATHLAVVRQLYLLVVEIIVAGSVVIVIEVLVCDIEDNGGLARLNESSFGRLELGTGTHTTDIHCQGTQHTPLVILPVVGVNRNSVGRIVVHHRRIVSRVFQNGIGGDTLVEHPFGDKILLRCISTHIIGRHIAHRVQRHTEELKSVQETLLGT